VNAPNKIDPPRNLKNLIRRYREGESMKSIAADLGISRNVVTRWLSDAGVEIRGRSDAMYARMANATPEQRAAWSDAAHAAVRGKKLSKATKRRRARAKSKRIGYGEKVLADAMLARGWKIEAQAAIDIFNVDIVIAKRIAVEPCAGTSPKKHTLFKIPHLINAGLIPVVVSRARVINESNVDKVIRLLDLLRREKPTKGEHWVIRSYEHRALLECQPNDFALVDA
jgi:transcriptional regulator with XRE-family HTH domain